MLSAAAMASAIATIFTSYLQLNKQQHKKRTF